MKNHNSIPQTLSRKNSAWMPVFALAGALFLLAGAWSAHAANILKADTTTMNAAADWGGTAPSSASVGEFGATPSSATLAAMTLGGSITLGGLQFDSTMAGPLTIASGNTLSVSSTGILFQTGAPTVTIGCTVGVPTAQTWTIPAGDTLSLTGSTAWGAGEIATFAVSGSLTVPAINTGNGSGGVLMTGTGTITGADINIQKGGSTVSGTPTAASPLTMPTTSGVYVNGPTVTLSTLELGSGNAGGYARVDSGSLTVTGEVQDGENGTTRWSGLEVTGGSFTCNDTAHGIEIAKNNGATKNSQSVLEVLGGTLTSGRIAFGDSADSGAGTGFFLVKGGTCYVGSGGVVQASPSGTYVRTFSLFSGTMGATATWSTSLPIAMSGSAGTPFVFQTADASSVAHNITLSGALSGTGSITATGGGVLTLAGVNTYAGTTAINGGTVNAGVADVPGTSGPFGSANTVASITFGGGTLQYSSLNNHDYSPRFSTAGSQPISIDTAGQNVTFGTAIAGTGTTLALQNSTGSGSLTLSVANSYTGNTTITSGTLNLGASGTTGSGNVALNGGTLAGTGTVAGTVTVASGAAVVPGASGVGVLTLGGLTVGTGSGITFVPGGDSITTTTLTLNGSPGTAFTLLTAGGSPFSSAGTYTLINYTTEAGSDTVGSDATWTTDINLNPHIANPQFGLKYSFVDTGTSIQLVISSTLTSGTWNGSGSDNLWSDAVNWTDSSGSGAPNGVGASATFDNGSATTMGPILLNGATTVASITFNNPASYVIASDGNILTLDDNGSGANLVVTGGSANQINDAVSLNDNVTASVSVSDALTIGGAIANAAASKTLTINGAGVTVLSAANSYGPASGSVGTVLTGGGLLNVGNANALGAGDLSVTANSTLQAGGSLTLANNVRVGGGVTATVDNAGDTFGLSGIISGATGTLNAIGAGSLTLGAANTYGGGTIINAATVNFSADGAAAGNAGSLGDVPASATANNIIINGGHLAATAALTLHANRGIGIGPTPGADVGTYVANLDNTSGGLVTVNGVIASAGNTGTDNLNINAVAGTIALGGANTYGGTAVINSGTLQLNNASALQNAILNYNTGTLTFNGISSATIGQFEGSQGLSLQNATPAAVALTTGGNNATWAYGGALSGLGSLTKTGSGTLTLTGNNSYAGSTTGIAGILAVSTGGVINGGAANCNGGEILVNGGSLTATTGSIVGTLEVSSGTANYTTSLSSGSSGTAYSFLIPGGTLTAATMSIGRGTSTFTSIPTAGNTTDIYITGGALDVTGNLTMTTDTSSASLRIDTGSATVGGVLLIEQATGGRWSVADVNGGTLTVGDATTGIGVGGSEGGSGELLVRAGTATTPIITFAGTGAAGTTALTLNGTGTLYVGAGGMVQPSGGAPTIALGGTATLAATAPWSSSLAMGLSGTPNTIQAADSFGAAQSITLSGVLSGGGAVTKTGAGTLTLNAADSYNGNTTISAGTLALGATASLASPTISIAGGATFDVSSQSTYVFPAATTSLVASGDAPATINGAPSGFVTLPATTALTMKLTSVGNAAPLPALTIAQATLNLNGNTFVVNTANSQPLPPGTYTLIATPGAINESGTYPAPTGTAIGWPSTTPTVSVSGHNVVLSISHACVGGDTTIGDTISGDLQSVELDFTNLFGLETVVGYNMIDCTFTSGTAIAYGVSIPLSGASLPAVNAGAAGGGTPVTLPLGTTNLTLTATESTPHAGDARVNAQVNDSCGLPTSFDPILARLYMSQSGELRMVIPGVNLHDRYVTLKNANPGLRAARLIVNGTVFALNGLVSGETATLDISSALTAGNNAVVLEAFGLKGSGAEVVIGEAPGGAAAGGIQIAPSASASLAGTFINLPDPQISQQGNQVLISWPATGPGGEDFTAYQLQVSATGLPGSWSAEATAPVVSGGEVSVTVPAGGTAQYYQLAQ
ncbi:MAG: autotransporter-associated beta strand repeat-containing protein [Verrucomicrobiota bacterium]